jgi:RAB protein geranylgeranyltransferase component A
MYGVGELSQAFTRKCAVSAGVYMLRQQRIKLVVAPSTATALGSQDGERDGDNDDVVNDVMQNDVTQNDVTQNVVAQNDVTQNDVMQNDVMQEQRQQKKKIVGVVLDEGEVIFTENVIVRPECVPESLPTFTDQESVSSKHDDKATTKSNKVSECCSGVVLIVKTPTSASRLVVHLTLDIYKYVYIYMFNVCMY